MKKKTGRAFFGVGRATLIAAVLIWLSLLHMPSLICVSADADAKSSIKIKNAIIMIPDGMGIGSYTLARWFKGEELSLDRLACGTVRTYSSNSAITDSAAAATAYATGFKTQNGYVGTLPRISITPQSPQLPDGAAETPVANILEAARIKGLATGIVCTCEFMHATPAGFSAHYPDREQYDSLSEQQLYSGIDLIFAGGRKFIRAQNRADAEDIEGEISSLGFSYIQTPEQLKNANGGKICGIFAEKSFAHAVDRNPEKEPSLAEMTAKALEILSKNEKGFVLMVEGSQIDWAAHANDPVALVHEILAFDEAVKIVVEFAREKGETVVLAMSDHGTGGANLGSALGKNAESRPENFLSALRKARTSASRLAAEIGSCEDIGKIREMFSEKYGVENITEEELAAVQNSIAKKSQTPLAHIPGQIISSISNIGWTTHDHTGEDVILFAWTPFERPSGVFQNNQIPQIICEWLSLDLKNTSKLLFRDASAEFAKLGFKIEILNPEVPSAAILRVGNGSESVELRSSKNHALFSGEKIKYPYGQNIYNGRKFFVPLCALDIVSEKISKNTVE